MAKRSFYVSLGILVASGLFPAVVSAQAPPYVTQWGSLGSGDGQFRGPYGVAIDAAGDVFVTDSGNNRIQKFTNTGTYLAQWGSHGRGSGQFDAPAGVAIDAAGDVYVVDYANNRVQKVTGTGTYLTQWGFEEAELRAVLRELKPHLRPLVQFLALTGWRVGEARQLTWRHVDFGAGTVRLEPGTTKNDEARTFPFDALPMLAELLRAQRERTSALERELGTLIPWVFHRSGNRILSFHQGWVNACTRAGVAGRLVHDLRRTAVRNLERAGVARSVAMKLTGHKTDSVYRRYAIVSEADLSEGVRKLAALQG